MEDSRLHTLDRATSLGLIIIAVMQGYALYALHLAIDHEHWLAADQRWLKALYTLTIGLPAFYLISIVQLRGRINLLPLLLAPLLFWLGWHLGWVEQMPETTRQRHQFTFAFCMAAGVALFILALFFRSGAANGTWPTAYQPLLGYSWEHALTLAQLGLFVGVFWALLWLWAALFDAIGLGFFKSLFQEPAFIYPVSWLVIGLGLVMIRNRFRFIANVRLMCEALIKALLPLVALIILLFFAVLPWTGLQPIWDTGKAAQMLMALMLTLLLFFNAVFHQPRDKPPYPAWLRGPILLAVVLLPLGSLLAAWALWLRIDQYGLTLDRLWAAVLQILTAAFTFSYSLILLWRRHTALPSLQRANLWLALLVAVVLVLINTPLADMRHWAAQHQVKRLMDGRTTVDDFDYAYIRFQLGQPGDIALRALADSEFAETKPDLTRRIERVLEQTNRWSQDAVVDTDSLSEVALQFNVSPDDAVLPESLLALLIEQKSPCLSRIKPCRALRIDNEPRFQWLIEVHHGYQTLAYTEQNTGWQPTGSLERLGAIQARHTDDCEKVMPELDLQRIPGPLTIYQSGPCLYSLRPNLEAGRHQLSSPP
ncbi:DUF4153 domain-containing protein [Halopseudomonas salegens]|uniref:DUF4153 domain-containing protein n=1 Tax=Halopseudomonas salegens TaxID=1434072 RepID=A0A1H2G2M0_9GAMM|nr:DUF4153 domain-containing protein [Halopseudomonas salegens]SDU13912.1 protein of unknown function [Halopseudomonas salegens]